MTNRSTKINNTKNRHQTPFLINVPNNTRRNTQTSFPCVYVYNFIGILLLSSCYSSAEKPRIGYEIYVHI
ncbi:hypothetical protein L2E82_33119 [Cichorium intybus]|uniref:Uncharacterized protein n=1 Tax=Cichorium intybus TaxID=13427 RepID=A0ACB9BJC5_CICIN|nr:hypothetical protein L2E82_33119 [Cichorium intybus]